MDRHLEDSDFRRLLDLADTIQSSHEASERRIATFRFAEALALIGAVLIAALGAMADYNSERLSALVIAAFVGVAVAAAHVFMLRRLQIRAYRDRRALDEVVPLLRELEALTARDEGWSPIERAEYRIRLSRFDIA